ncbi:ATPase [Sphingobacteriaceae bacterium]|nr:ATPase [Sphingobacteriaceae bacterium]
MEKRGILKIAVVGAESTGKSWLCEELARHYKTVWVPEYAREYFNDSDIYNYTLDDLVVIAKKQIALEQQLTNQARRFLFCDTTLITLKIWAELEFEQTPDYIDQHLKDTHYDYYLITDNQIPWEADPLRQNKHSREKLFEMNLAEVQKSLIPYTIISGKRQERLKNAVKIMEVL